MQIVTFSYDDKGATTFGHEQVDLHKGLKTEATAPSMSSAQSCKRYYFTELPPGFASIKDFSSRCQLCVLLSGDLELTSSAGDVQRFHAGSVIRLEDTDYENPGRAMRVVGDQPARILSVQIE